MLSNHHAVRERLNSMIMMRNNNYRFLRARRREGERSFVISSIVLPEGNS